MERRDAAQMIEMQMRDHHRQWQMGERGDHRADIAGARTGVEQ